MVKRELDPAIYRKEFALSDFPLAAMIGYACINSGI